MTGTWNVTVGYYAVSGSAVLTASTVAEALAAYGADRLLGDVKQAVPLVQAILLAGEPWRPPPDAALLVKTGKSGAVSAGSLTSQQDTYCLCPDNYDKHKFTYFS